MSKDHVDLPTRTLLGYVTPYLPKEARSEIRGWRAGGKPVFIKAFERSEIEGVCPNCQGNEILIVNLIQSGPHKSPPGGVITWLDGTDTVREGWYRIEKTLTYPCPKCGGQP
jgi:predicted RNA-binding Zn-ribbon protein involved in translation (DUF1610 family)